MTTHPVDIRTGGPARPVEPAWRATLQRYAPVALAFCLLVLLTGAVVVPLYSEPGLWSVWRGLSVTLIALGLAALVIYLMLVVHQLEVAQQVHTEDKRQFGELNERLGAALDHIADGVICMDIRGDVTLVNNKAAELTGWRGEEAVGVPLNEVFRLSDAQLLPDPGKGRGLAGLFGDHVRSGRPERAAKLVSRRRCEHEVIYSISPVLDREGWLYGGILTFRDVTELRHAEQQREALIAELSETNKRLGDEIATREAGRRAALSLMQDAQQAQAALAESNKQLRESNIALEEYARVASHDLQEPLRKIESFAEVVLEDCGPQVDGTGRRYLQIMADAAKRMRRLIKDVLAFSSAGSADRPFEPVDLNEILAIVKDDLSARIAERSAILRVADLPVVLGDKTQMTQLFENLVGNALKFNDSENPSVEVAREELPDGWRITVKDNGIGISETEVRYIFAPFKRLHGRGAYEGTGIGLAICRKIVNRHGGDIRVESERGRGSAFIVTLPKTLAVPSALNHTHAGANSRQERGS